MVVALNHYLLAIGPRCWPLRPLQPAVAFMNEPPRVNQTRAQAPCARRASPARAPHCGTQSSSVLSVCPPTDQNTARVRSWAGLPTFAAQGAFLSEEANTQWSPGSAGWGFGFLPQTFLSSNWPAHQKFGKIAGFTSTKKIIQPAFRPRDHDKVWTMSEQHRFPSLTSTWTAHFQVSCQ